MKDIIMTSEFEYYDNVQDIPNELILMIENEYHNSFEKVFAKKNERWNKTDVIISGLPHNQFNSIYNSHDYLIFTYIAGGLASSPVYDIYLKENGALKEICSFSTFFYPPNLFNMVVLLRFEENTLNHTIIETETLPKQ